MVGKVGYTVQGLKRLRVAHIQLGKLKKGNWRNLTSEERKKLIDLVT